MELGGQFKDLLRAGSVTRIVIRFSVVHPYVVMKKSRSHPARLSTAAW